MVKLEFVYKARDNTIDLILKANGAAVDLSGVTKMDLIFPTAVIGSDQNPAVFDWSVGGGKLILALGGSLKDSNGTPVEFVGVYSPNLIVYDDANGAGIVWGFIKLKFC